MPESSEQDEALRIGTTYMREGKPDLAKIWLQRSMPNPTGALLLAQLYARSRAMRASRKALFYLSFSIRRTGDLDIAERRTVEALIVDLMKRRLHPFECRRPDTRSDFDRGGA